MSIKVQYAKRERGFVSPIAKSKRWNKQETGFKAITGWWNDEKGKYISVSHIKKGIWTVGMTGEYPIDFGKKYQALRYAKNRMKEVI